LYEAAIDQFSRVVDEVPDTAWRSPTPCADWDVRELVNHMVGENLWLPPLAAGQTIAEVGDALDGDLLGDDPRQAWRDSVAGALAAAKGVDLDATVHLSFGDVPAQEYLWQLTADALVHSWDLARSTGQQEALPADVVGAVSDWFDDREELYRSGGAIGPATATTSQDPQDQLIARFGRTP
jgi:uncharacterized protein (TIGR03086 family)